MELKPYIFQRCKEIDNARVEIIMEALYNHRQRLSAADTVRLVLAGGGSGISSSSQSRTLHAALDDALRAKNWPWNVELNPVRETGQFRSRRFIPCTSLHHPAALMFDSTDDIVRGLSRITCEPELGYAVRANKHYVLAHDAPDAPMELAEVEHQVIYYHNLAMHDFDGPTNINEPENVLRIATVREDESP
ncbi:hypothetical protein LTR56_028031, partial [Elasticomyces elasticus]